MTNITVNNPKIELAQVALNIPVFTQEDVERIRLMTMLKSRLPSKLDWYNYITNYSKSIIFVLVHILFLEHCYLPPYSSFPMAFIAAIIGNSKKKFCLIKTW